jgi:SAM-dependent methyltransferase
MHTDVIELRDFYETSLGRIARRMIGRRVRQVWPDVRGMRILGLGFTTPFLGAFRTEAERVLAMMPAAQGALPWPEDEGSLTALVDEEDLPLPDRCMDRIFLVHALECAAPTRPLMREAWRVLADGGRLLVVVPNRQSLWAQFEHTPFGHGRPYSATQLSKDLRDALFTPAQTSAALYVPPVRSRMVLSSAAAFENIGHRWFRTFAGTLIFEATKEIYTANPVASPAAARAAKPAYVPVAGGFAGGCGRLSACAMSEPSWARPDRKHRPDRHYRKGLS